MGSMFERIRTGLRELDLEILHVPHGQELIVSDAPAFTFRFDDAARISTGHAVGDAHGIVMPIAKDCLAVIGPTYKTHYLSSDEVALFNRLQIERAIQFVWFRPGSLQPFERRIDASTDGDVVESVGVHDVQGRVPASCLGRRPSSGDQRCLRAVHGHYALTERELASVEAVLAPLEPRAGATWDDLDAVTTDVLDGFAHARTSMRLNSTESSCPAGLRSNIPFTITRLPSMSRTASV
jgi:hypothetical protein